MADDAEELLRQYGPAQQPKDEDGFLFSTRNGELKFNPWEAVKNFMSYRGAPGHLSTSGDDQVIRDAADTAGWIGLSGLGLNATGAIPTQALGSAGGRLTNPIKVYHGSPYDFDKFMMEKIGTGEGNQAFGHGLYFAENEKVANEYRKRLAAAHPGAHQQYSVTTPWGSKIEFDSARSVDKPLPDGVAPELAHAVKLVYWDGLQKAKSYTSQWLKDAQKGQGVYPDRGVDYYQKLYDYVRQMKTKDVDLRQGRMYEVGLHADPERFVNLDKSKMDQQPREFQALVRDGLKREGYLGAKDDGPRQLQSALGAFKMQHGGMGSSVTDAIMSERGGLLGKSAQEVSTTLNDAGIPGLKYKDQWSRSGRGGTHNYVVWQPEIIEILKKYGVVGPVAALTTADILKQYGDDKEKP